MLGLKAISTNNGWEYAIVGICIVFSGLVILSIVISQLHKLLNLWENRSAILSAMRENRKKAPLKSPAKEELSERALNLVEAKKQYRLLVSRLSDPFALPKLLRLAEKSGLHRPHSTLNDLIQAGIIEPDATGYFIWKE